MRLNRLFILGALVFISSVAFVGCRKKEDTIAKIYVRNAGNEPVAGAKVVLKATSSTQTPTDLSFNTISDYTGIATFNLNEIYQLGQAGVAVLDIEVTKGAETGSGIMKIEQEIVNEEIVYIQ